MNTENFLFIGLPSSWTQTLRFTLKGVDLTFVNHVSDVASHVKHGKEVMVVFGKDLSDSDTMELLRQWRSYDWITLWGVDYSSTDATQFASNIRVNKGENETSNSSGNSTGGTLDSQVETLEKGLIQEAMEKTNFNQVHAARLLGLTRGTLQYKLKKYQIKKTIPTAFPKAA